MGHLKAAQPTAYTPAHEAIKNGTTPFFTPFLNFSENYIYISKLGQKSHYEMGKNGSSSFIMATRWGHLKVAPPTP